jgi:hypothetical protein
MTMKSWTTLDERSGWTQENVGTLMIHFQSSKYQKKQCYCGVRCNPNYYANTPERINQ